MQRRSSKRAYLRPSASSAEHGLKGEYFRGRDFSGEPVLTRIDARVAFRWDRGAPTDDLVARGELPKNARSVAMTSACAGPGNCCRPFPDAMS